MSFNRRSLYFRILFTAVVVVGLVNWAIIKRNDNQRDDELERFALAYAQAGVARALSRGDTTEFLRERNSIASELGISTEMALDFSETFRGSEDELAAFWRKVKGKTDSIVALHQATPADSSQPSRPQNSSVAASDSVRDSASDSAHSESTKSKINPMEILIKSVADTT